MPCLNQLILGVVEILKFVHQEMVKTAPAGGIQLQSLGEQVVKVQNAQGLKPLSICLDQLGSRRLLRQHAVFHPGHRLQKFPGIPPDSGTSENAISQGQGFALADEGDITQQAQADGMKRSNRHGGHNTAPAKPLLQPGTHLGGSLVGKGHCGNLFRPDTLLFYQPCDAFHQGPGFAGAGTGSYHHNRG